ncbi:alanine dehydrogenase [Roseospira marina]|uniref:Alanine dehydrogenase n=1 Tax=Roseospira marina TaxID=140057 RepID=A0A5M6I7C5_9PROT|nr:alanine dehydrogenase [Roseospira marina]KAA5604161.1 alanine dehydrogenase [Roseospira marina]MBB4315742.1 alanine dehydrogenase [Roseospira marina]MBB5088909.1 alanine dehydrogenase [Roseospira marina]
MRIGVPKEIKPQEFRVGMTPDGAHELTTHGHEVVVESGAGVGIDASDAAYEAAGARVLPDAAAVFDTAELIVKVKEPLAVERARLRPDHVLFTYLHLAPDVPQTRELVASGATCIAYETITDATGGLPLLKPMSQVAGRLSVQAGAQALERAHGGRGLLMGGVPGVAPARVAVIGGGVVGENAIQVALGLGADVAVLDRNPLVLERLAHRFGPALTTLFSSKAVLEQAVLDADVVIGAVLIAGADTPKLVTRDMVSRMKQGAALVDVAIDQGGCFETSHPTTHQEPTYIVDGTVHYCVANMPGCVPNTSTYALTNATLPYVLRLANLGWRAALQADPHFRRGLNVANGRITCQPVAEAQGLPFLAAEEALAA